ncbi:hypothetical protein RP20_CCG026498 [Aedes albopictus]|uniref:Hexosyltransferase n=1 Tax=Aedes albopictus TaxID=7160 RepID=A0A023ENE0_AEDAL|nr:hypothetical protein RP20_CCG026498 [Aedes albopictus]
MTRFFEKFTLFCVITVITALSLIIVTSVQLAYEPETVINRDNDKLLDQFKSMRQSSSWTKFNDTSEKCDQYKHTKLFILVQSPKSNRKVRQAIRDTWAFVESYPTVQIKFALTKLPGLQNEHERFIHRHLKHFYHQCVPGDYLLITNDMHFINTPQIITAINQRLPRSHTTICAKASNNKAIDEAKYLGQCNIHAPILFSKDAVRRLLDSNPHTDTSSSSSIIHYGAHLYLTPKETQRIINGSIDASNLLFFFSNRVRSASDISLLWNASIDYTAVES